MQIRGKTLYLGITDLQINPLRNFRNEIKPDFRNEIKSDFRPAYPCHHSARSRYHLH